MGAVESAPLREDGTPRSYFAQVVDPHGLLVEPSGDYSGTARPELCGDLPSVASNHEAPPSPTVATVENEPTASDAHISLDLGDFANLLSDIGSDSDVGPKNCRPIDGCDDGVPLTGQALMDESMERLAGGALFKRLSSSSESSTRTGHRRIESGEDIHRQRLRSQSSKDCRLQKPLV